MDEREKDQTEADQTTDTSQSSGDIPQETIDQITAAVSEQFKAQIDGLNRRVSQEQKEKQSLAQQLEERDKKSKSVQEQLEDMRRDQEQYRRDAALREKKAQWRTEAVKRRLSENLANVLDSSLSVEDGVTALDAIAENATKTAEQLVNEKLSKTRSPGNGDADDTKAKRDEDLTFEELVEKEEREMAAAAEGANGVPPGIGIA